MSEKKPLNLKLSNITHNSEKIARTYLKPWRVLIVDDEEDVHSVTRLIMAKTVFKQRAIELLSAYSAAEAYEILKREKNIAVILLDVVMESDNAGLKLVQSIREELDNKSVRIILRTGQPGQAPEERVIIDYDINDYKAKSELTAQKLFTCLIAGLRAYETIITLEKTRMGLEKILGSTDTLFQISSIREFASGLLLQVSSFLDCKPDGIICIEESLDIDFSIGMPCNELKIVAAVGEYSSCEGCHLKDGCIHKDIARIILRALQMRESQFDARYTVIFLETTDSKAIVALVNGGRVIDENDQHLLKVFASKISIALANAIHYQKMISFEEAATTDFLTGLNNRRQLIRVGIPLVEVAGRTHTPLVVAMFDIDHFKRINDTYGHDAGDLVLKNIASLLKQRFRSSDIVSRYGGEEFCVVALNLDAEKAFVLFDSFREAVARQITCLPDGRELVVTISIGVSTVSSAHLEEMISRADDSLYRAKSLGRNRVVIGDEWVK